MTKTNRLCSIGRSIVYKHVTACNRTRYSVKREGVVTARWVRFDDLPYYIKETVAKAIHAEEKNHA